MRGGVHPALARNPIKSFFATGRAEGRALAAAITLLTYVAEAGIRIARAETPLQAAPNVTHYRTDTVEGITLFYREAGPSNGPVVLLLRLPDVVAYVPEPDPNAGGPLSCDRSRLSGVWPERRA